MDNVSRIKALGKGPHIHSRIFIAIDVPQKVRDLASEFRELLGVELDSYGDGVKWTGSKQIHLTLKFLGDVETGRIDGVKEAVRTAAKATKPFTLTATDFGAFPNPAKPRVLWVGVNTKNDKSDRSEELIALHKKLDAELEKVGFPRDERDFSPHLTIGRVKSSEARRAVAGGLKKLRSSAPVDFEVSRVIVFKSTLGSGGAVHTPLYEALLLEHD